MNCKPGDLAIVVRELPGAILKCGTIVTCVELLEWAVSAVDGSLFKNVWLVDHNGMRAAPDGNLFGTADECLRPIRPGDLEDEAPTVRELEAA